MQGGATYALNRAAVNLSSGCQEFGICRHGNMFVVPLRFLLMETSQHFTRVRDMCALQQSP